MACSKDIPQQQVQITAHIISSSRTALQALGLEWGMLGESATDGHHSRYNRYSSQSGQMALNVLRLGEGLLEMKLNALEKKIYCQLLPARVWWHPTNSPLASNKAAKFPMSPPPIKKPRSV